MRVLVTGAGGFVGLHLLREVLSQDGNEVFATAPVELPTGTTPTVAGVEWIPMDVTFSESIDEAVARVRPEIVYHLAGQASVGASFQAPLVTWDVNATGTLRLMTALQRLSPETRRVVLASSAEVYGVVAPDSQPIRESTVPCPVNPYGASKAAAEAAALGGSRPAGLEVVIARTFNLIGSGQDARFVLPSIARQIVSLANQDGKERSLKLGNLAVERDFLDIRDAVRGYVLLMERGRDGEAYNICSGVAKPLSLVVKRLVELSGADVEITVEQSRVRPNDIPVLTGANNRLKALGWTPRYDLDESLRSILEEAGHRA